MNLSTALRRFTGLAVLVAFSWLLLVTAAPLSAGNDRDSPGAVEHSGYRPPSSKSSILPIIIVVVAVAAIAAVLILVVFKTKYDINGAWDITFQWAGNMAGHAVDTFTGSKSSGTFTASDVAGGGTYTVDGKNVTFTFNNSPHAKYVGTFTDKNHMSGTMSNDNGFSGTWSAVRKGLTPATQIAETRSGLDSNGK